MGVLEEVELIGCILLLAVVGYVCFTIGERIDDDRWQKKAAAAQALSDKLHADDLARADAATTAAAARAKMLDEHLTAAQDNVRTITQVIHDKVPVYITAAADRACIVPRGFVRLHDAAAAGVDPGIGAGAAAANGGDDAADSGIAISGVARVVATNYGITHADEQILAAWRQYAADVSAWWQQVKPLCKG